MSTYSRIKLARIYRSSDISPVVPTNQSVWQLLQSVNPDGALPDKLILQEFARRDQTLTYGGLRQMTPQTAKGLMVVTGAVPGNIVVILASNSVNWAVLAHAGLWCGVVVASINPLATSYELVHQLGILQPKAVFVEPAQHSKIQETQKLAGGDLNFQIHFLAPEKQPQGKTFPHDFLSYGSAPVYDLSAVDNREVPAAICFSSGTSGKPKAVQLSHGNLCAYCLVPRASSHENSNITTIEVFFAPFCHIYGFVAAVLATACIGSFTVLLNDFEFHKYIRSVAEFQATVLRVVPSTAIAMTKDPVVATLDLTCVKTIQCSAAVLGEDTLAALQKSMPAAVVTQGYGMTEGGVTILKNSVAKHKAGSVGTVMALQEVRIVDDDLKDLQPGETGEIMVQGRTVFMGYLHNLPATQEAFPFSDGWMRTGDVGRFDKDGYLYLLDRKKELIKYKGYVYIAFSAPPTVIKRKLMRNSNQVPPAELEDVVQSHPAVLEAAVCATWDDQHETEVPIAYARLRPEIKPEDREKVLAEVRAFVDGRVSPYKKLRGGCVHIDTVPRSPTGKILRRLLPARIQMEARDKAASRPAKL